MNWSYSAMAAHVGVYGVQGLVGLAKAEQRKAGKNYELHFARSSIDPI
jgi:hypothetical protein